MRNRYILLADLLLLAVAAFGAFTLRFDWLFLQRRPEFWGFAVAVLLIKPVVFYFFGMYTRYWRYATTNDLVAVILAVSAGSTAVAVYVGVGRAVGWVGDFSRPVLLIDWLLTIIVAGGVRMSVRVIGEAHQRSQRVSSRSGVTRVLVVGAGEAGTLMVRELQRNPQLGAVPIGYLDDAREKQGKRISGVPVLGSIDDLSDLVRSHRVDQIVIAMPRAGGAVVRSVAEACRRLGIESRTVPGIYELLGGKVSISRLRNVDIADLLRRDPVDGDTESAAFVRGRVVLITGAGGSIGSELARQIANRSPSLLVLLGHGENSVFDVEAAIRADFPLVTLRTVIADIRDARRLAQVFDRIKPEIVFHAAAHKHVPLMEENPEEAVSNNIVGTRNVVQQALRSGAERFVLISTDKAVAPSSVMGATKRIAEAIVRQAAQRSGRAFVAVRFGNVLGSRGSVVNTFKAQIERGGPVTVTHPEMTRFFMTIPEAVHLVLQASGQGLGGELYVLEMGKPVKIVDLAQDLIRLSGFTEEDVPIVYTHVRPGEKLEEILYEPGTQTQPTSHPDVLRVVGADSCVSEELDEIVARFEAAACDGDRRAIEALFARTIPGFVPRLEKAVPRTAPSGSIH